MKLTPAKLSFTIPLLFGYGFGIVHISSGQENTTEENTTEAEPTEKMEMSNVTSAQNITGPIPSLATPGAKSFHVFTAEIADVDEEKLKVAGDAYSVSTLVVNKDDKVTVNFYNVDPVKEERHSFTIGDPYKVDIDVAFAENGNVTFTADNEGIFPYYCKYHLPVMVGQLVVLPQ
jgi:nitrous oxide reductase